MSDISKKLFEKGKVVLPFSVNSPIRYFEPYPFFTKSGKGSKIVTVDNKILLDYCMAYGSLLMGHAFEPVLEQVNMQLEKGTLYGIPTEKEIELAELLNRILPSAEMTRLVNTGAEATMTSIRLSRAFTGKTKILKFDGCYHGAYDYVLMNSGSGSGNIPVSLGIPTESISQTISIKFNDISLVEEQVKKDTDIACIIIEPVAANMGLILPELSYLQELRKITQRENIILIFDEVITGFRMNLGGAAEYFGIRPDLCTFSKALGAGFPIAALCGKREIMEMLAPSGRVYQASTYAGNPISVTASIALLQILKEQKNVIYPKLSKICDLLVNGIKDSIYDNNLNVKVNSISSMFQVFFASEIPMDFDDVKKSNIIKFKKYFNYLLESNIFIPPSQFETCFISHSHNEDDVDKTIDVISNALKMASN